MRIFSALLLVCAFALGQQINVNQIRPGTVNGQVPQVSGCPSACKFGLGTAGTGDVTGPPFALINNIPMFSTTTGKVLIDSGVDSTNLAAVHTGNNWGGVQNYGGATALTVPIASGLTTALTGNIGYDQTGNQVHFGINNTDRILPFRATTTPTIGKCALWGAGGILGETDCGSGTGTVTTNGTMTLNALVTSNATTVIQTPSATATLDSSGNMILPGSLTTNPGGGAAGYFEAGQGTAPSIVANRIQIVAPASVTGYQFILPGVSASGVLVGANSANVNTVSFKGIQGTDTNLLSAGTISGTAAPLCTTANGGATTTGCSSGGGASLTTTDRGFWPAGYIPGTGAGAITAGAGFTSLEPRGQCLPNPFTGGLKVSSIQVWASTADTGKNVIVGIYDPATDNLVTNGASTSTSLTGTGEKKITWSTPPTFTGSTICFVFMMDSTTARLGTSDPSTVQSEMMNQGTEPQVFTLATQGSLTLPSSMGTRTAKNTSGSTTGMYVRP